MRLSKPASILRGGLIGLILLGVLDLVRINPVQGGAAAQVETTEGILPQQTPYAPTTTKIFLPLTTYTGSPINLLASWIADSTGNPKTVFLPYDDVKYTLSIANSSASAKWATIRWTQSGPCGEVLIENQNIKFSPGITKHVFASKMLDCQGIQTNLVEVTHNQATSPDAFQHITTTEFQGFDMCSLPTTTQMQTWWNQSPYWTINLYIGGISRACNPPNLNQTWLSAVAQQGWSYTLTWVGPQAPCTNFKYPMSGNAATAKTQGRAEADKAVAAAKNLGFTNDKNIYYDLEGYSNNATTSCKAAVAAFLQGWVERIHELGFSAGIYGGACSSFAADWASNPSPPDDVWLAHWYKSSFFREAHVWNTPCVANALWPDHQRLKQYAGDHQETWGGVGPFTIDSNVLDGAVSTFLAAPATQDVVPDSQFDPYPGTLVLDPAQAIDTVELLSPDTGWALRGERLLWTQDGATSWQDITPEPEVLGSEILGVTFLDDPSTGQAPETTGSVPERAGPGWVVQRVLLEDDQIETTVSHTADSGESWDTDPLPLSSEEAAAIATATPHFLDALTGWITLKLQSGSNFSLGRLFATQDGGQTWEERSLPLGEPVRFVDPLNGWVAGGPAGDQLFRTQDGGQTWEALSLPLLGDFDAAYPDLPQFADAQHGRLPVTLTGADGSNLVLFATADGGETWSLETSLDLDSSLSPAAALPFSLARDGSWGTAAPGGGHFYRATPEGVVLPQSANGLTGAVIALDFADEETGWALVQEGTCTGTKLPNGVPASPGSELLRCEQHARLMATGDGGTTWRELTLEQ